MKTIMILITAALAGCSWFAPPPVHTEAPVMHYHVHHALPARAVEPTPPAVIMAPTQCYRQSGKETIISRDPTCR